MKNPLKSRTGAVVAGAVVMVFGSLTLGSGPAAWAADVVNGDRLKQNSVDSTEIQNNSLTAADLADGTVTGVDIKDNSVATQDIADGTIRANDIATGGVDTLEIKDQSVSLADIDPVAIGEIKKQVANERGGDTGIVGYSDAVNGPANGWGSYGAGRDGFILVNVKNSTENAIRVTLESGPGYVFGSCIAAPVEGFGTSTCSFAVAGSVGTAPYVWAKNAAGEVRGNGIEVETTFVVVG